MSVVGHCGEFGTEADEETAGKLVGVMEHIVLYDVEDRVNVEPRLLRVFWVIQHLD